MVSFIAAVFISIALGLVAGAVLIILMWYVISKFKDRKAKKNIPIEELKDQVAHTKPRQVEKEVEEDERRRINKIREFEKLRRTPISKLDTPESAGFYARTFGEPERVVLSDKTAEPIKTNDNQSSRPEQKSSGDKPINRKRVKFD